MRIPTQFSKYNIRALTVQVRALTVQVVTVQVMMTVDPKYNAATPNTMLNPRPFHLPLLVLCFALSGGAGLIYQTVWSQQLAQVFGASEMAVATVLASYMGGLALGATLAGLWVQRLRRPILVYGLLELAIAVTALLVPAALQLANRLQVLLLADQEMPSVASSIDSLVFYSLASFLILLLPTALMGATLPLLARQVVQRDEHIASRVGLLYAANTLGAALGALGSAFVLLPNLGLRRTVWVAVALNAAVFVAAALLARLQSSITTARIPEPQPLAPEPRCGADTPSSPSSALIEVWILPVMLISGAVAFTYEILWTRLLAHLLGGSIYAFGTMLATFLVGLALGAGLASRFAYRKRQALHLFIVSQLTIAATSWLAFLAIEALPEWIRGTSGQGSAWLSGPWLCATILLPSTLAIGATFPLAVRILTPTADMTALASARVFSWNTVGAIVGAIGCGFFLLPWLGYVAMVQLGIVASLLLAAVTAWRSAFRRPLLAVVGLALVAVVVLPPPTPWSVLRHSALGDESGEAAFFAVGRSANVLLLERGDGWRLTTNGLPEALILPPGARLGELPIARWLTHLPFLARPDAESLLVIGLGGGSALEELPETVQEVHVVELEPEVVRANRTLSQRRRRDPLQDPRLHLHLDDARSALRLSRRAFDAIVSQPSHPWTAGASHLFTREFFQQVSARLQPDGVFVQWIGLAFVDEPLLRSLVATLQDVFPHVEVYSPEGQAALFLASQRPLRLENHLRRGLQGSAEVWASLDAHRPADILAHRLLSSRDARSFAGDARLILDGDNLLQTRSPRLRASRLQRWQVDTLFAAYDGFDGTLHADRVWGAWQLARRGFPRRATRLLEALPEGQRLASGQALVALAGQDPATAEALLRPAASAEILEPATVFAHLQIFRNELAAGRPSSLLQRWKGKPELAVAEGWALAKQRRWAEIAELENILASIGNDQPLFAEAIRLRVRWRLELLADGPTAAPEALALLQQSLPAHPSAADLILRFRAGRSEGRSEVSRASLFELLRGIEQQRYGGQLVGTVRRLADELAEDLANRQSEEGVEEETGYLKALDGRLLRLQQR